MKKSTLTRFDNENIVFVEIENQEGTAKIIDEVNNTVIDIGGGGGGISNPVIEVTFINNTGSSGGPLLNVFDENDNMVKQIQFEFADGATEVVNTVILPSSYDGPEGPFWYYETISLFGVTVTASDAVNCAYDSGEQALTLTDPTENGSITLTLS